MKMGHLSGVFVGLVRGGHSASYGQADSKSSLFAEHSTEHPQDMYGVYLKEVC